MVLDLFFNPSGRICIDVQMWIRNLGLNGDVQNISNVEAINHFHKKKHLTSSQKTNIER